MVLCAPGLLGEMLFADILILCQVSGAALHRSGSI